MRNMSYRHARMVRRRNARTLQNEIIVAVMGIAVAIGVIVALAERLRYHY
jgi:hypothetical protein